MEILSAKEIAGYLKINEKKVYQLVKDGDVPFMRLGGKIVFSREVIDRWILEKTEQERNILVVGSDDPLLRRLLDLFNKSSSRVAFYAPVGSVTGLQILAKGGAGVGAVHIMDPDGKHALAYLDRFLNRREYVVIRLFSREQGFFLPPGNPQGIKTFRDLAHKKIRFTTRNPGSGTRLLIDWLVAKEKIAQGGRIAPSGEASSHLDAGLQVLTGQADAAFGIRYVAEMLKLGFVPVLQEPFDLVLPAHSFETRIIREFLRVFDPSTLLPLVGDIVGYDVSAMGSVVWRGDR